MNRRAFSRILELVLVLVLLFALVTTLTQAMNPPPKTKENLQVLSRYSSDMKNMICNSRQDRETIIQNLSLSDINSSINYVKPKGLKHRIVVLNATDETIIQATNPQPEQDITVMTSSCMIMKDNDELELVVMVWY